MISSQTGLQVFYMIHYTAFGIKIEQLFPNGDDRNGSASIERASLPWGPSAAVRQNPVHWLGEDFTDETLGFKL